MKLTVFGPVPDNLFAVFYDPQKLGSSEQQACRDTNVCRLLGFGACPAAFLRAERAVSLAAVEIDGETKVVTLIGGVRGVEVADFQPNFIGTHYKTGVGRELCDFAIERETHGNTKYGGPDPQAP